MNLTPAAIREIHNLQKECERILAQTTVSRSDGKRADILISQIASIRATGVSTDERNETLANELAREIGAPHTDFSKRKSHAQKIYKRFLQGASEVELQKELRATTFVAGTQSLGYTQGTAGGFLVPSEYHKDIREGMSAADPLLDAEVVTLVQEENYALRPLSLPGWDLSTAAAVKVGEIAQHGGDAIPTLTTKLLNNFAYRIAFDASTEWEEDSSSSYGDPMAALSRAQGVAIARGVGADLVNGDGTTGPQGIVTGSADSGVVTGALGAISFTDFSNVFFAVNKIYRESSKAAWLVNDAVMKQIRNAKDSSNRPLFPVHKGIVKIYGAPVLTCPSLPAYNASLGTQSAGSFCVFGDLSAFTVHASAVLARRLTQVPGLVEYGKVRLHSLIMVDAAVNDPTAGALPPIVTARLHS